MLLKQTRTVWKGCFPYKYRNVQIKMQGQKSLEYLPPWFIVYFLCTCRSQKNRFISKRNVFSYEIAFYTFFFILNETWTLTPDLCKAELLITALLPLPVSHFSKLVRSECLRISSLRLLPAIKYSHICKKQLGEKMDSGKHDHSKPHFMREES